MASRGPLRDDGHNHPQYWEKTDQHRFEDRVSKELHEMRNDLEKLAGRVLLMFGGIAVLAFIIPLVIPMARNWLSIPSVP